MPSPIHHPIHANANIQLLILKRINKNHSEDLDPQNIIVFMSNAKFPTF